MGEGGMGWWADARWWDGMKWAGIKKLRVFPILSFSYPYNQSPRCSQSLWMYCISEATSARRLLCTRVVSCLFEPRPSQESNPRLDTSQRCSLSYGHKVVASL